MSDDKASQLASFLASLTISRVATGLALGAGGVLLYGQYSDGAKANVLLLSVIGVGMLSLAIGAAMWGKLETTQAEIAAQRKATEAELKATVSELRALVAGMQTRLDAGAADRADLRSQLEACLARDKALQRRFSALDQRLDQTEARKTSTDFGMLGEGG